MREIHGPTRQGRHAASQALRLYRPFEQRRYVMTIKNWKHLQLAAGECTSRGVHDAAHREQRADREDCVAWPRLARGLLVRPGPGRMGDCAQGLGGIAVRARRRDASSGPRRLRRDPAPCASPGHRNRPVRADRLARGASQLSQRLPFVSQIRMVWQARANHGAAKQFRGTSARRLHPAPTGPHRVPCRWGLSAPAWHGNLGGFE
jgi:hypothetical protein